MCGIVGLCNTNKANKQYVVNACSKMHQRGPDNMETISLKDEICFGHVRLSILDLTVDSNQPFYSLCKNYSLTFNGEIYNYKEIKSLLEAEGCQFRTNGDTEVLLQLYMSKGVSGLKYLRGMFAFGIWDNIKNTILLSRDICGEKPLYYSYSDGNFGFASTLSALLELKIVPPIIDIEQVLNYLHDGFAECDRSLIKNIRKVKPGSYIEYNLSNGNIDHGTYWSFPNSNQKITTNSPEKKLKSILEKTIEEQLYADVETSILLSGGLDSSLITALASNVKRKVRTFSVSFNSDKKNNEIKHANKIAKYFNTSHTILDVDTPSLNSLIEICENIDEPFIDSSFIPTSFLAKEVGKYTKVVLGGDGADELFGGYNHYKRLTTLNQIHNVEFIRKTLRKSSNIVRLFESDSNRFKWINIACQDLKAIVPKTAIYFRNPGNIINTEKIFVQKSKSHNNRLLEASMEMDFKNYLVSDILVKVDRAMMSASVESRSPFLDKRVVEFAYSKTSLKNKIDHSNGKIILQNIAKQLLPIDYEFGRKQGFNFDIGSLMAKNEIISYMKEELNVYSLFDKNLFDTLLQKNSQYQNKGELLYGLFILAFWIKKNKVEWIY